MLVLGAQNTGKTGRFITDRQKYQWAEKQTEETYAGQKVKEE